MLKINKDIIAQGESIVNSSGVASISRKYKGMRVIWIIPKVQLPDNTVKQNKRKEGVN